MIIPMLLYVGVACFLAAVATGRSWRLYDKHVDDLLALAVIVAAALVAGFNDLGTDAPIYREYYSQLSGFVDRYVWWEPGFEWVATLFAEMGAGYGLFVFVCMMVSNLIKLYVFEASGCNKMLALFVIYCLDLCEIAFVRQYLAASLIFLAFFFIVKGRSIKAAIAIIAATFIHKSAFIVGLIVLLSQVKRSGLKTVAGFILLVVLAVLVMPTEILGSFVGRLVAQSGDYSKEGFVQGFGSEGISLIRNVVKFLFYLLVAFWMVAVPAQTPAQQLQRKAGYVVIVLSVISIPFVIVLSPVFSRLSLYIFPFLALSVRAERFRLRPALLVSQYAVGGAFIGNLVVSIYPLITLSVL